MQYWIVTSKAKTPKVLNKKFKLFKTPQPCAKKIKKPPWLDSNQKDPEVLSSFVYWPAVSEFASKKKTSFFPSSFWCSEEHAFSSSSEFRGDLRWVAQPHSLITRSKTPAELQAALRGIKPPPARASFGLTCQDAINSYRQQPWTFPVVQISSHVFIFCPYLHNITLVSNGLLGNIVCQFA